MNLMSVAENSGKVNGVYQDLSIPEVMSDSL